MRIMKQCFLPNGNAEKDKAEGDPEKGQQRGYGGMGIRRPDQWRRMPLVGMPKESGILPMPEYRWLGVQCAPLQWAMRPLRECMRDWLEQQNSSDERTEVNLQGGARGAAGAPASERRAAIFGIEAI